jgi:hypothetical protein
MPVILSLTNLFPAQHTLTVLSIFFLDQQNHLFQGHPKFLFLTPIGSLSGWVWANGCWCYGWANGAWVPLLQFLLFPT